MLSSPTVADLSTFSGKTSDELGTFATQALAQASLLMSVSTSIQAWPDASTDAYQLLKNGICEMALVLSDQQKWSEVINSPFTSESYGSHSYSKASLNSMVTLLKAGKETGVFWFDLAVSELSVKASVVDLGGIEFSTPGMYVDDEDNRVFVGPNDTINESLLDGNYVRDTVEGSIY